MKLEQKFSFVSGSAAPLTVLTSANVTQQCMSPTKYYIFESYCILLHFIPVNIYKENEIFTALIHAGLRSLIKILY